MAVLDTGLTVDVFASSLFFVEIMGLCPMSPQALKGLKEKLYQNNLFVFLLAQVFFF